jgi:D-3-phosphoglycerate dehydrogenase
VQPRLVYFDQWTDPVAGEIIADHGGFEVTRLEITGPVAANWAGLEQAHGYQSLIRTEVPRNPGVADQWITGPALLDRCPQLLAVCSAGAGYDIIDVDACTAAGVIVCNNSGPGREAVAEHALGLMLALAKKIALADRMIRREVVQDRTALRSTELFGKTLGIVGVGQIGGRLVELCAPFAMTVLAYDPYLSDDQAAARGVSCVELDELLERADFVHLNCPLTTETEGLMGAEQFARMKPAAFFITTARGPVHDEVALYDALASGAIAGAGIDVFHDEPPDPTHPLLSLDTVMASPHTAGLTVEATRDVALATAEQWITIFAGKVPPRLVNPEVWPAYSERFAAQFGVRPVEEPCP